MPRDGAAESAAVCVRAPACRAQRPPESERKPMNTLRRVALLGAAVFTFIVRESLFLGRDT
jgi:hypothetical protein